MEYDYERHYSRWHADSDQHARNQGRWDVERIRQFLPEDKDGLILEIGCGRGYNLGGLIDAGYANVRGFDANSSQLKYADRRGLPVDLVPIADTSGYLTKFQGAVALVMAMDVLEHVPQDEIIPLVRKLVACLRPGGRLVCRVPNAAALTGGYMRYVDFTHYIAFTVPSLDFVLHNAGLTNIEVLPEADVGPIRGPGDVAYAVLRRLVRAAGHVVHAAEFGRRSAFGTPMTPNLIGTAVLAA